MGRAQTIRGAGLVAASLLLITGCDPVRKRPSPAARERKPQTEPSSSALVAVPARPEPSLLPPIAHALEEAREKAELVPPRYDPSRLAFGKGRLAQALPSKVLFRDTKEGAVVTEAELGAVRAVTAAIDGSLIALGLTSGARLDPHLSKARSFARVAFFPGAALFPDLEDPSHFYVYYAGEAQLFHYGFEAEAGSFLPIEDRFPLLGCVGALGLTRDGAFVCGTADGVERRAPRGREARFSRPAGMAAPIRLLPAKRLDELFSVTRTGEVTRFRLQPGLPQLARFQLPALPFAAAANADALAFVLVSPPGSSPRRWTLLVTDFDGAERLKAELPSQVTLSSEDWLEQTTGDKDLAISEFQPLVAVGGAGSVTVWDYARGSSLFTR